MESLRTKPINSSVNEVNPVRFGDGVQFGYRPYNVYDDQLKGRCSFLHFY